MNSTENENISSTNNKTIELTYDQCDYKSLFSHLPISFQLTPTSQQLIYHPHFDAEFQQQATYKLCFASVCILFGCFFSMCGYRFLKLSTFLVGFSLGSSVIYLILSEQKQLTLLENLIISLSIGVLFAFVALLVQYIGLFLIGITSSVSLVTCILILIDLFYTNKSAWLCIGLLFACATLVASITLKFQKSFTIINTSIIGSALLLIAVDFFVENNLLVDYIYELYRVNGHMFKIYERHNALLKPSNANLLLSTLKTVTTTTTTTTSSVLLKSNDNLLSNSTLISNSATSNTGSKALALFLRLYSSAQLKLCWYTWLIFSSFFVLLLFSLLVQFLITGKHYDHRDSWQKLIRGNRRKKSANLEKIRLKSNMSESESSTRHHHYHHHNHHSDGSSSSSNLELVPCSKSSKHATNDTMLLVEEASRPKHYKVTSSNGSRHVGQPKGKRSKSDSSKSTQHPSTSTNSDNFEIISFEVIKPANKMKPPSASKSKPTKSKSNTQQDKNSNVALIKETSASTSTTASTSSASSSSSSTCQLIPLKLNTNQSSSETNPSLSTNTTALTTSQSVSPKKAQAKPSVPPAQAISGSLCIPPPVPTIPPPKLPAPLLKSSHTSSTLNSSTNPANSLLHGAHLPTKMKHHRSSVTSKDTKDDKAASSDKFRRIYQVRRNHGDALSQDFINNVQTKLSASNLNNNTCSSAANEVNSASLQQQHKSSSLTTNDKKKSKSKP